VSGLADRITAVLRLHEWWLAGNLGVPGMKDATTYKCLCGWNGDDPRAHVAEQIAEALKADERAVRETLGDTEETTTRPVLVYDDPPAPKRTNLVNAPEEVWATHFEFVSSRRFIGQWEPHMEHADSMRPWSPVPEEQP
jgi:hypothetical protein